MLKAGKDFHIPLLLWLGSGKLLALKPFIESIFALRMVSKLNRKVEKQRFMWDGVAWSLLLELILRACGTIFAISSFVCWCDFDVGCDLIFHLQNVVDTFNRRWIKLVVKLILKFPDDSKTTDRNHGNSGRCYEIKNDEFNMPCW